MFDKLDTDLFPMIQRIKTCNSYREKREEERERGKLGDKKKTELQLKCIIYYEG